METPSNFRSGFINIVGKPNAGKSTLMNALVGERLSIITAKPQTTRHRLIGIVGGDDYQMVFSDTPGFINKTNYKMQERMNGFVRSAFEDADLMILMIDATEPYGSEEEALLEMMQTQSVPIYLVINKIDLISPEALEQLEKEWQGRFKFTAIFPVAALHKQGTEALFETLQQALPQGPAYYPPDQLTDRPERFFVAEIVREKILELYHQEIPYSCEVLVESFKEDPDPARNLVRIGAIVFVSRKSQKPILIGKAGKAIKALGIASREAIEVFLEKKVHLELFVKVRENWRDDERNLEQFGYHA